MKRTFILSFLLLIIAAAAGAARPTDIYEVRIAPDGDSWTVPAGQKVKYVIDVTANGLPADGVEIDYSISRDLMEPHISGKAKTKKGRITVEGGTMKEPGFLRCKASATIDGKSYSSLGTIGFSPEAIRPVSAFPSDFKAFWDKAIADAGSVDLNPRMELLPDKCTDKVNAYQVSYCVGSPSRRFYAMVAIPKAEGKYPAVVQYPGAGIYAIGAPTTIAEEGVIAMAVGIHAIPNNLPDNVYRNLDGGALRGYPTFNMHNRDAYYYKAVIQGAVRAIDLLNTLPQFNGCVATFGGSQGGYLAIAVGALHPDVKFIAANFPAMSDLAGYTKGRAGGWPHIFKNPANRTPLLLDNLSYYDTVNFARLVNIPGFYTFGFNDLTCAPTTTYAVYNSIEAPKTLLTTPLSGHFTLTEQAAAQRRAMLDFLKECR